MPEVRPTLKQGDSGEFVKIMQEDFDKAGYEIGVDGEFGTETESKLRLFQMDHSLTVDGVCGPKTWAVLKKYEDDSITLSRTTFADWRRELQDIANKIDKVMGDL